MATECRYFQESDKATVTHSRSWLRFTTISPDVTYTVKLGCIGMDKTENLEITLVSRDVPTVSVSTNLLRFMSMLLRCYNGSATT